MMQIKQTLIIAIIKKYLPSVLNGQKTAQKRMRLSEQIGPPRDKDAQMFHNGNLLPS